MESGNSGVVRRHREPEPPTLAFRLKAYKAAIQQLRCVVRSLKDNTTVTFLPTPALVVQTVRNQFVGKIVFNSSCLYVTDRSFAPKTINNHVPLVGNLMYMSSNRELTKFIVQDNSDLSARVCMSAPDFNMDFSSACVHNQDIVVRESGNSVARVDFDFSVVGELIKWIGPHIRPKRNSKKQIMPTGTVQITLLPNPPMVKFSLAPNIEVEFTAGNRVAFHEVKNLRASVQARNLYQAFNHCAVTKLTCTLRIMTDYETVVYIGSKNNVFSIENFLSEEPFVRNDVSYDRGIGGALNSNYQTNSGSSGGDDFSVCADQVIESCSKKHDRSGRKGGGGGGSDRGGLGDDHGGVSSKEKHEQHKITSFMVSKSGSGGVSGGGGGSGLSGGSDRGGGSSGGGYFNDAKEESDSDESVSFDYVPSAKKQKC